MNKIINLYKIVEIEVIIVTSIFLICLLEGLEMSILVFLIPSALYKVYYTLYKVLMVKHISLQERFKYITIGMFQGMIPFVYIIRFIKDYFNRSSFETKKDININIKLKEYSKYIMILKLTKLILIYLCIFTALLFVDFLPLMITLSIIGYIRFKPSIFNRANGIFNNILYNDYDCETMIEIYKHLSDKYDYREMNIIYINALLLSSNKEQTIEAFTKMQNRRCSKAWYYYVSLSIFYSDTQYNEYCKSYRKKYDDEENIKYDRFMVLIKGINCNEYENTLKIIENNDIEYNNIERILLEYYKGLCFYNLKQYQEMNESLNFVISKGNNLDIVRKSKELLETIIIN